MTKHISLYKIITFVKLHTPFCGLKISRCSTFTCTSTSDPLENSLSQIGHWNDEPWGAGDIDMALNARVGLSSVRVGLLRPRVGLFRLKVGLFATRVGLSELAFAFPITEGEVRSKWARLMCSSSFRGHVDVKSQSRHCNINVGNCTYIINSHQI